MAGVSDATAAPFTVRVAGKEWLFSPLTIRDLGAVEQWARSKVVQLGRDAATGLGTRDAAAVLDAAFRTATRINMMSAAVPGDDGAAQSILSSVDGVLTMLKLSLRHRHTDVTDSDVETIISDPSTDAKQLVEEVMRLSGQHVQQPGRFPKEG